MFGNKLPLLTAHCPTVVPFANSDRDFESGKNYDFANLSIPKRSLCLAALTSFSIGPNH
jgi:hypothetical protein